MKKIVCGALGNIYYGTISPKSQLLSADKKNVTDEAIGAVFQWFVHQYEFNKIETDPEFVLTYPSSEYELVMRKKEYFK